MVTRRMLSDSVIEGISKILGDTSKGLTGSEIKRLLEKSHIKDLYPTETKWKRLYEAFVYEQSVSQSSTKILVFIQKTLSPSQFVDNLDVFKRFQDDINKQLCFEGYRLNDKAKFEEIEKASTISEAQSIADNLLKILQSRNAHSEILRYCNAELLANNYFHAVFEATKSVFDRIRRLSLIQADGNELIEKVFSKDPTLTINDYTTQSEKNEHTGFCNILKGLCGMFRNTQAHEPKITWDMNEQDALEILALLSYCHRRLDNAKRIKP